MWDGTVRDQPHLLGESSINATFSGNSDTSPFADCHPEPHTGANPDTDAGTHRCEHACSHPHGYSSPRRHTRTYRNANHHPAYRNTYHYPAYRNTYHYPAYRNTYHHPAYRNTYHHPAYRNTYHHPAYRNTYHYPAYRNDGSTLPLNQRWGGTQLRGEGGRIRHLLGR